MTRSSNIFFSRLFSVYLCAALFMYPTVVLAQAEPGGAYFNVIKLDRSDPSMVELTLSRGAGSSSEATNVEIIEDGISQTILQNSVEESELQLAVLIDPRMMETVGTSGQPGYLEMVGVILKLIAANDGMDSSSADGADIASTDGQFAVFSADEDDDLRVIQDWTSDMDRLFSSILKQHSDIRAGNSEPIQDALLASLDIFNEADASTRTTKAVLLFSAGFDGDNLGEEELARLEQQLRSAQIQMYVAQLAPADQPVLIDESLSRLSSGTNGYLMTVGPEADFTGLFQRIDDASTQQIITYSSDQTPEEVSIELTFENGSALTKKVDGNGGPFVAAAPQAAPVPTAQLSDESADLVADTNGEATNAISSNAISIPGTEISVPRNAIYLGLATLLAVLAYFFFSNFRARRAEKNRQEQLASLYGDNPELNPAPQHHNYIQSQREPVTMQGQQTERSTAYDAQSAEKIDFDFDNILQEAIAQEADKEKPAVVIPDVQNPVRRESTKQDPVIGKPVQPEIIIDTPDLQEPAISKLVQVEPVEQELVEREPADSPTIQEPARAEPVIIDKPVSQDFDAKKAVDEKPNTDLWDAQPNQIDFEQQTFDATLDINMNRFETMKARDKMSTIHADYGEAPIGAQSHNSGTVEPISTRLLLGYFVRVTDEPNLPLRLPLYEEESIDNDDLPQVRIGRNGKVNEIVINAKRVSREHAIMIQKEDGLYLRDNNSSLGTYLNWHKLRDGEELLLKNNDLVGFGDISYEFRLQDEQKDMRE